MDRVTQKTKRYKCLYSKPKYNDALLLMLFGKKLKQETMYSWKQCMLNVRYANIPNC